MEAHSFRHSIVRIKNRILSRAVFLPVIALLLFFVGGIGIAHAGPGNYDEYLDLFTWKKNENASRNATLNILRKTRPSASQDATPVHDFIFNFQGGFPLIEDRPEMSDESNWFWDHIYEDTDESFIVRVCEVDASGAITSPNNCVFTGVPNDTDVEPEDERIIDTQGNTERICKDGPDGKTKCTLPGPNDAWTQIYTFRTKVDSTRSADGDRLERDNSGPGSERTDFNIIFKATEFKNIVTENTVALPTFFPIGGAQTFKADMWYCGEEDDYGNDEEFTTETTTRYAALGSVNTFNNLCGGDRPYFKIAESSPFQIPADGSTTPAPIDPTGGSTINTNNAQKVDDGLPECGIVSGTIVGCVARVVYYLIYWPIAWFAGLMGSLFDFFLGYSLSDASYRAEFAVRGWQIVRDISNIFFIIILVWTGLSTVFEIGGNGATMKRVVPALILNALFINFSLFGTRVIIDLSNVVARVFYNSVEVCEGKCQPKDESGKIPNIKTGPGGSKPLSEKIVSSFNPQRIFAGPILDQARATENIDNSKSASSDAQVAGYFIIVSLIAAFILFMIAMMFWKTAFFFLSRVIGLYVAMIFAPFAVLTRGNMPLLGGVKEISWTKWWEDLTNYALLAPIFVFFLYIIYSFLETDFISVYLGKVGDTFFETVIYIAVPMLIVYFMIKQGVTIAEKYSGEIGKKMSGFVNGTLAATAIGVASGGLASVARGTIGRASSAMANSNTLRKWSGSDNWLARQVGNAGVKVGESGSKAAFDVRNTGLMKQMGVDGSKENKFITKLTRTTTDNTKGGVVGSTDRKEKRGYDRMKTFQLTGDMAAAQDAKAKAWEAANIDAALTAWKNDPANAHLVNDDYAVKQEKDRLIRAADPTNSRPKTAKAINLERNKDYGTRAQKASLVQKVSGKIFGAQGGVAGTAGAVGASAAMGAFGGILSAVGGEMATGGAADARIGANVGKLAAHEAEISRLNGLIGPLESTAISVGLTPAEKAQLDMFKSKLKSEESKRDALSEKLTKKD